MNYVQEYIDKIRSGEITVCKKVKKLYFNIVEPVLLGKDPRYYFDEAQGEIFIKFAENFCRQSKGEWNGSLIKLELFQKAKYQAIFGILKTGTRLRRFTEVFDVRGRKNGKSTENAVLGLYLTIDEKGAEIYAAATTSLQARRVWEESQSMRNKNKYLTRALTCKVFPTPTITAVGRDSYYKVLSKNTQNQDGLNSSGAIIDECHELKRPVYDILKQSMSTRDQPLLSMISTAGFVRAGLYDDQYEYCEKVLDLLVEDDTIFPLIYELDSPGEIDNEKCWIKANPGLGTMKKIETLRANVNRMKGDPNFANSVKTKDFNLRGVENRAWLDFETINVRDPEHPDRPLVYSDEQLKAFKNTYVIGGFDLSRTIDLTAFTTLLMDKAKHRVIAITMYWATLEFLEQQKTSGSKVPWKAWVDRGLIRISGDKQIDYHDVANYIAANFKTNGWMYVAINYDPYSAGYLVNEIENMGYSKDGCLNAVPQGAKTLSIPMQTVQVYLKEGRLCYQDNPVTKWMLSNVELELDRNGNYLPKKASDKRERKIDGPATILDCFVALCKDVNYYLGL